MNFTKSYAFIDICARVEQALKAGNSEELGYILAGLTRSSMVAVMQAVAAAHKKSSKK